MSKRLKIRTEHAVNTRGFTRWIRPAMDSYIMVCCGCGLAHELQFKVVFRARRSKRYSRKPR